MKYGGSQEPQHNWENIGHKDARQKHVSIRLRIPRQLNKISNNFTMQGIHT